VATQSLDCLRAPGKYFVREADLLCVRHPVFDAAERAAIEQVGRMGDVTRGAQRVCKRNDSRGQTLRVMEEN
jgi:hypothetical protein